MKNSYYEDTPFWNMYNNFPKDIFSKKKLISKKTVYIEKLGHVCNPLDFELKKIMKEIPKKFNSMWKWRYNKSIIINK